MNITFRAIEPEDVGVLESIENDRTQWNLAEQIAPVSTELLREYAANYDADPFRSGQLRLVVTNDRGDVVGLADLYEIDVIHQRAMVGIYILPDYRHRGYSLESLKKLEVYTANVLGLRQLAARVVSDNRVSIRLFRRAGYRKAGTLRDWYRRGHTFVDVHIFQRILWE